jgi:signal transduction histidine kinase
VAEGLNVAGDRELLGQMVANLLENAMKHSPPDATISLIAARRAGTAEIEVADNGPGIPAAEHGRVFARFYRLEHSRSTPGSGLGLSLVQAIAAEHRIGIELSDNHPGLRVILRFPPMATRELRQGERPRTSLDPVSRDPTSRDPISRGPDATG